MTRLHYATDLTDVQWALLEALLGEGRIGLRSSTGTSPGRSRWFCSIAEALDCGADVCVVEKVSSAQQGLRT